MDLAFGIGCHVYGHASPQDVTGVLWSCNMAKMVSERCRPHFSTASKGQSCKMSIVIDWTEQFWESVPPPHQSSTVLLSPFVFQACGC